MKQTVKLLTVAVLVWCDWVGAAAQPATQATAKAPEPTIVIHAGTLLAVPGEAPKYGASVLVKGGRIEAILPGYQAPPGAEIVDLSHATVLPGLIDCHVHLMSSRKNKNGQKGGRGRGEAQYILNALENAATTLDAGFTTVRDLGADADGIFAVRDAIEAGRFRGPRVIAAGHMVSVTAGHGDESLYSDKPLGRLSGICDGPYQCRSAVRAQVGAGADVIKISTTGGGGDDNGTADAAPEMSADEVSAIVETAHSLGRKVAAHAHGTAGINTALRAGVDSIEHGGFLDAESIRLFKARGAFLVPTMSVLNGIEADYADADPKVQPLMRTFLDRMPSNISSAYRAGVQIAFGTDAGVTEHGRNAQEFKWYAKISMTPADAIRTATVNAAALLGMGDRLGTIEVGKYADIIATPGDPLQNVEALQNVTYVMKAGVTVRNERTVKPESTQVQGE